MTAVPRPSLTAALCTRGRPEMLARALESLAAQGAPPDEVVVVDNDPPDGRTEVLVRSRYPGIRYVVEPCRGLDLARNRALETARSDIVAFLDDDAVADPGWSAGFRARFADRPALGVCTGRVEALECDAPGPRLFEANGGFSRGLDPIHLPADLDRDLHGRPAPPIAWAVSVGCGASMAVRRETARGLGGFDPALDRGAALPGGGDLDMIWRALDAGWEVAYAPEILAWHEHRPDVPSVARQLAGHQKALSAFLVKSVLRARGRTRSEIAAFLLWRLVKPGARLLRRLVGRDPLPAGIIVRMWWSAVTGLLAYRAPAGETVKTRGRPRLGREVL